MWLENALYLQLKHFINFQAKIQDYIVHCYMARHPFAQCIF